MGDSFTAKNKKTERLVFFLSLGASAFWGIGKVMDVYQFAAVGAVYELLWLPFLTLLVGLPLVSFVFWAKEKFKLSSLYLYATLICAATLIGMIASG
ncbi:hypothetical protein D0X99_15330 [Algoriphagus lacus]|uniref:Uncharacterized protein n=1 Tax=Algoriphagus lacus TaxID=2056311 RepID=A0A418PNM5_9BACT|nr:hypothetical protein [Algoriphagus lacus]RIW13615.1 hypothetical protein D0X99_15330 [Algoriphagus lacus]